MKYHYPVLPVMLCFYQSRICDLFSVFRKLYSDPAGRFITPSISSNNYILVIYRYDSSTIHPIAMPFRTKKSQVAAYKTDITLLKQKGFSPKLATLDNETSDLLLQSLENNDIAIHLVPPHIHRRNAAERALYAFKSHFVAIICGTDLKFPPNL